MKVAALDLGSNTFLCLICEVQAGKITQVFSDEVQIVRLGQGLSGAKKFHPDALARAEKTLTEFAKTIEKHKPEKILAMATSAARDAENKEELFSICKKLNIPLQIISGNQEAEITYSGSVSGFSDETSRMVIDIGGGSTEYIVGLGQKLLSGHSQNIGCVRLTEMFIKDQPTKSEDIDLCKKHLRQVIEESKQKLNVKIDQILAVAGTPTALVTAQLGRFDVEKIEGFILTRDDLEDWLVRLTSTSVEEKIKMGIPPGRADVILVGVLILLVTLEVFDKKEITVSTRGVRYGIALQMQS